MSRRFERRLLWRVCVASLVGLLLSLQVAACGGPATPACGMGGEPAHPEIGGVLLYYCYGPTSKGDLFLLDVTSGHAQRLTNSAWNVDASWSPEGRRIVFQSTRGGRSDLYVMDVTTGSTRRLPDGKGFNGYPSWSPDGRWIVFESSRDGITSPPDPPGFFRDIFLVRPDGSDLHRLLNLRGVNAGAAWAPTGEMIAFQSDRAGAFDIYTVRPDGTDLRQLTHHERSGGFATYPRWSADSSMIVFDAAIPFRSPSFIYSMAAEGGPANRLTNDRSATWDGFPDWSPDGRWIVFTRNRDNLQLYAVRPDGTGLTQLTNDAGDKDQPRWRPQ